MLYEVITDHLLAPLLRLVLQLGGNLDFLETHPLGRIVPENRFLV